MKTTLPTRCEELQQMKNRGSILTQEAEGYLANCTKNSKKFKKSSSKKQSMGVI
jgi:hypothetical protein